MRKLLVTGVAVFLGALSVWLWRAGSSLHHAYAAAIDCHPAGSTACSELVINFDTTGGMLKGGLVNISTSVAVLLPGNGGSPVRASYSTQANE